MKITLSDAAFNDLESIKKHYEQEHIAHIGEQFVIQIIEHIETLNSHPDIGRVVPEFDDEKMRELIHPPFRIVYLREHNTIRIIRVWRSERLMTSL